MLSSSPNNGEDYFNPNRHVTLIRNPVLAGRSKLKRKDSIHSQQTSSNNVPTSILSVNRVKFFT